MCARITIGLLAHVDAGKTTLAEQLMYTCGNIAAPGRVDHGNAHLDTDEMERNRGITIFSSQAEIRYHHLAITLLDTPGHTDFSAEMERTLQVLDYAILIVSGPDGVQGHVRTLWKLLEEYEIPVFLFINKMDQPGVGKEEILSVLKAELNENCVLSEDPEEQAMCDEELLEEYLETGSVSPEAVRELILSRKMFPCFYGSALKGEGIRELLESIAVYTEPPVFPVKFGARVYKISRDKKGNRLTHMKITGGSVKVKDYLGDEKIDQIRIYSGDSFEACDSVAAGTICAVTGIQKSVVGDVFGIDAEEYGWEDPRLEPVLNYEILLPENVNPVEIMPKLLQIVEENPELQISRQEESGRIHVHVMGEIQLEILRDIIDKRYGVSVSFDEGRIIYKETVSAFCEGVGHYEPLKHYAEVHLLIEPLPPGEGIVIGSICPEDVLDRNWQRLILTHLSERCFPGPLTGAELTDVKITIAGGRAHAKHTEGGDFRQATYRALRQGLLNLWQQGKILLLEPIYAYEIILPREYIGRAMNDIRMRGGTISEPEIVKGISESARDRMRIRGQVPVSEFINYHRELMSYTHGEGQLNCVTEGYAPCHDWERVCEEKGYDPERDENNPGGSIFCVHGSGSHIPWNRVPEKAHIPMGQYRDYLRKSSEYAGTASASETIGTDGSEKRYDGEDDYARRQITNQELESIWTRTYGSKGGTKKPGYAGRHKKSFEGKRRSDAYRGNPSGRCASMAGRGQNVPGKEPGKEYLLVDGYNIIHAWPELLELAERNLGAARGRLMDILSNYQGYRGMTLILVFDAYKVPGNTGSVSKYHNIHVVYTKEAETADQYIEKTVHEIGRKYHVTVATSDGLEQIIIMGENGFRMSAGELLQAVEGAGKEVREEIGLFSEKLTNTVLQDLENT